jgi:hypothetical protein
MRPTAITTGAISVPTVTIARRQAGGLEVDHHDWVQSILLGSPRRGPGVVDVPDPWRWSIHNALARGALSLILAR